MRCTRSKTLCGSNYRQQYCCSPRDMGLEWPCEDVGDCKTKFYGGGVCFPKPQNGMTCVSSPDLCKRKYEKEINRECPNENWVKDEALGCFLFGDVQMTWEGAQEFCTSQTAKVRIDHSTAHTSPSHLVEVNTEEIQNFVVEGKAKGRVYWIGARDNDEEGEWRWEVNGNLINESFTNWQDGQQPKYETNPLVDQEDCLELGRWNGELWNDNKCTWSQNYPLCHIPFQGQSKCFCCDTRPKSPPLPCVDTGCLDTWDGLGQCINVTEVKDWGKLAEEYDLSVKDTKGACSAPEEAEGIPPRHVVLETTGQYGDCCRCMKMKACEDTGCKAKEGTCVDVRNEDLEKYSDLDLSNDLGNDLCGAMHEETFCKCFKKRSQSTPDQYTLDDDYYQYDADYETTTTQNLE